MEGKHIKIDKNQQVGKKKKKKKKKNRQCLYVTHLVLKHCFCPVPPDFPRAPDILVK